MAARLPVGERRLPARQYGIARDNEELELGVRCMAAGIYDDQSRLVAGVRPQPDDAKLRPASAERRPFSRRASVT